MAASSAMPYGTWRGSSSSRMRGLMKSSLAMVDGASGGVLEEGVERGGGDAGPKEESPLRTVDGLARHGTLGVDESLAIPVAQELPQLRVVLGLLVRRARRIAEIDADEPDPPLAEHGVGEHPGRGADIAPTVEAR